MAQTAADLEFESDEFRHGTLPLVERIVVKGLHGRSNYDLDLRTDGQNGNLSLLYGDNGTGKTTLLRVLWDLLSPAPKRNHRTRVANTAFARFSVFLVDGTEIRATRKVPTSGSYTIEVRKKGRLQSKSTWPESLPYEDFIENLPEGAPAPAMLRGDEELSKAAEHVRARRQYFDRLASFGSSPYFLSDNRRSSSDEVEEQAYFNDAQRHAKVAQRDDRERGFKNPIADELSQAISLVNSKLRRLTLGASVQGSAGANSVYIEVVRQLAKTSVLESDPIATRQTLMVQVEELGERNARFADLDLVPEFSSKELQKSIGEVEESSLANLQAIVRPFLKSLSARLDALEDARGLIQTLIDEANRYLIDKRVSYRQRVLRIELLNGQRLKAEQLSSGECHILLLLFNAVLASGNARLFIIDEPELSLNVKWQRRIVRSLLSLTQGTGLQFVLATHSIELLSGYRDRVVRLAPVGVDE